MLPPAEKARPAPVSMATLIVSSASTSSIAATRSSQSSMLPIAFNLAGLSSVRMAMRSRRSTRTKSPIDQTPLMRARRFGGRGLQQRAIATEGHEIAEQRRCSGNGHNHPDRSEEHTLNYSH